MTWLSVFATLAFFFGTRFSRGVVVDRWQHQMVGPVLELTRFDHFFDRPPHGEHAVFVDQAQTLGNHGRLDRLVRRLPGVGKNRSAKVGMHGEGGDRIQGSGVRDASGNHLPRRYRPSCYS